jgi:hypothetical protein
MFCLEVGSCRNDDSNHQLFTDLDLRLLSCCMQWGAFPHLVVSGGQETRDSRLVWQQPASAPRGHLVTRHSDQIRQMPRCYVRLLTCATRMTAA